MNMWRFSNRRFAGEARGVSLFMVCIISLLSSAGCALQRAQSAGDPILGEEKLARIESLSQRTRRLQHQLAELQTKSEARSQQLMLELESARRDSAEAEARCERLESELAAERSRHSEERAGHREEIAALNERITDLETSIENLLSQISVIRARHQVETTRLKKEIERLSGD